ncbi:hypothetical protein [Streptomyces chartreusis]|uniref:hypothetical protein n=1 Tax=Streptomyces chartreusis TaxID=1969 RepID=UPI00382226B0
MCGVQNGGSATTPASTSAHRCDAERKTFSHDAGRNGSPDSFSHNHSGSGPAGPSMNSVIRSDTSASDSGVRPSTPSWSRQCSTFLRKPATPVTSRIRGSRSYLPLAWARRIAAARDDST